MGRINEAKANIRGGKQRVEVAKGHGTHLKESYAETNKELFQAFKGLEKVLEHLGRADDKYRDEIKPRNAAMIVELSDASNLFFEPHDEGFWRDSDRESPMRMANDSYQDFQANEHYLQEGHTRLLDIIAALENAKTILQIELSPQTDASITGTPAEQTKEFAENTAPTIESTAQEWHDSL